MNAQEDAALLGERSPGREPERRWRSLVESSQVAMAVIRRDGTYAYANPRAALLYGVRSPADLVDRDAREFIAPGLEEDTTDLFLDALGGEVISGRPWSLRRANGTPVDIAVNARPIRYDDAAAVQLELQDISEQIAAKRALEESERSWRTLFGASPVGIGLSDERGRFVAANPALCSLLGRHVAEVIGHSSADFTHPDDLESHRNATTLIVGAPDGVARLEKRYVRPGGEVRWAWLTVTHTPGPHGETWTLAHVQDITERKEAERAIIDSEANLKAVSAVVQRIQSGADARQTIVDAGLALAQASYVGLIERTADGTALRVSATTHPEMLAVTIPLDAASVTATVLAEGQPIFLPDPGDDLRVDRALLERTGARSLYVVPVRSGPSVIGVLAVGWEQRVAGLDDRRAGVVTLLADQTGVALRQAELVAELEALALSDPLTGLPNRRSWDLHLEYLLAAARRDGRPLTIAMADLDHFKAFNDSRGHHAGDELLVRFAAAARLGIRAVDSLARWGGEEFAISLPNCPEHEAARALDRIRELVPLGQSCSIGYATWDGAESAQELLERVDRALYSAKESGRDQVRSADRPRRHHTEPALDSR